MSFPWKEEDGHRFRAHFGIIEAVVQPLNPHRLPGRTSTWVYRVSHTSSTRSDGSKAWRFGCFEDEFETEELAKKHAEMACEVLSESVQLLKLAARTEEMRKDPEYPLYTALDGLEHYAFQLQYYSQLEALRTRFIYGSPQVAALAAALQEVDPGVRTSWVEAVLNRLFVHLQPGHSFDHCPTVVGILCAAHRTDMAWFEWIASGFGEAPYAETNAINRAIRDLRHAFACAVPTPPALRRRSSG